MSDPSVQHLNYTAAWPITTDSIRCQQTGRKQSFTVNRFYKFTVLSQLNREDSRTSHNVHAQRKEQRTSETYPFKGTQNQQSHGGLTLNATTHSSCRLHVKAAKKHTDITRPQLKTCHAGNHHSRLFSQQGLYPPALIASLRSKSNLPPLRPT